MIYAVYKYQRKVVNS